jgi:hypothetical protein
MSVRDVCELFVVDSCFAYAHPLLPFVHFYRVILWWSGGAILKRQQPAGIANVAEKKRRLFLNGRMSDDGYRLLSPFLFYLFLRNG